MILTLINYDGRQFFYCHSVIPLPLGNSTATSTAVAVEIKISFYFHGCGILVTYSNLELSRVLDAKYVTNE